jgi:predicted O-linked N-acetylglucosamine transferase (SPINDLY family)
VFAERAAPVQVNYLGYPGTLGASYMDYIIADRHVIPPEHEQFYTEKIAYLPDCYQANDNQKPIGTHCLDRAQCRLPPGGFVFCCSNNSYKITPERFESWMRILRRVEGSVLWLLQNHAGVVANLTREAIARDVDPARLVFAERAPLSDHLARHALADLFLDTLPCNAHTTASDALWAGLPVLTQIGETFAGKVAASMLHAIGLPELIATTQQDYEALAIELAANLEKLEAIKRKLVANRLTAPLFDTERLTRHIEAAYLAMYERCQAGLPADHIVVPEQRW